MEPAGEPAADVTADKATDDVTIELPPPRLPPRRETIWTGLRDVIFPRSCLACHGIADDSSLRHLCRSCTRLVALVHEPHCTTCGHPFFGEMVDNRLCPHCELLRPQYGSGKTAILLKGPGRSLIHALKYHDALHVLPDIVALMRAVPGYVEFLRGKILVPVPLHPRKLRERGYNQSEILAGCAAIAAGKTARVEGLLARTVDTESQTHFDRATRQRNLKNAFALLPGAVINPRHNYLLVDDVFTTGSTLNACAAVLRQAGCLNLDVVTFGHG